MTYIITGEWDFNFRISRSNKHNKKRFKVEECHQRNKSEPNPPRQQKQEPESD